MRVTILYCGLSTASEVFLLANYTNSSERFLSLHYLVTSLKYSFLDTPRQYFMLLTPGG